MIDAPHEHRVPLLAKGEVALMVTAPIWIDRIIWTVTGRVMVSLPREWAGNAQTQAKRRDEREQVQVVEYAPSADEPK